MIFDRTPPTVRPKPRQFACEYCVWASADPDATLGHMFASHLNRRVRSVAPHAGRRAGDARSPWAQLRQAAADNGEGVSRPKHH